MSNEVSTFVISDSMANVIVNIFKNLQFSEANESKGLLITGNYGTGKSHLISFISGIAKDEKLVKDIRNLVVKQSSEIAGTFKVINSNPGATRIGLRDFVITELENGLEVMNVFYKFPSIDRDLNFIDSILDLMNVFEEKYPDKGLLFTLDDLLIYLRSRKIQEQLQDLLFLRELGEACNETRFRFIAAVQEPLFDNPSMQVTANGLHQLKARFQEVFIQEEDVKYVISERLKDNRKNVGLNSHKLDNYISRSGGIGRVIVVRLKSGSDLLRSLQEIIITKGLKAAVILSGVGLLSSAKLRNCKSLPDQFPITDQNRSYTAFDIPLEILGISGNISIADGKPLVHAHLTLSYVEAETIRVVGGHMIEGSKVFGFTEVILLELIDIEMVKEYDEETKTLQLFT